MAQLNAKAMNVLYCALGINEFNRIFTYSSTKEIWDRLKVTYEGTIQVKESKISILVHKYELFKIEHNETILGMYTCFTDIINHLKNLGKTYIDSELCRKILRSLPQMWEAKVTAIQKAKDLTFLKVEELLGSLMTHELILIQQDEDETKRKKSITLATEVQREREESSEEEKSDSEVALLARKIRNFMRKKKKTTR